MYYYYKCANTDVVGAIRETDKEDGDGVVDNLLVEVLPFHVERQSDDQGEVEGELQHVVGKDGREERLKCK